MKKFFTICLLMSVFTCLSVFGQTGINIENPNPNTLLHISEDKSSGKGDVEKKGIIIPRLTEAERDELTLKLGANDNSLMIFNTTENCYNFWNQAETSWRSLCGDAGNASFTFTCSDIEVRGDYFVNTELNASNFILIKNINVTKPGDYAFTVSTGSPNGYSFSASGKFLTTGPQTVRLIGEGIPQNARTDSYNLVTSSSSQTTACNNVSVQVSERIAQYNFDCKVIEVNGNYVNGTSNTGNTLKVRVAVQTLGSYHVYTNTMYGIYFAGKGTFTKTGPQDITLTGYGTLTNSDEFSLTIYTSLNTTFTCSANIKTIFQGMKYAIIGGADTYSWGDSYRKAALSSATNFGPNGKVKIQSFTEAWTVNDAAIAANNLALTLPNKPDIVLYNAYSLTPTPALITALNNYVNAGGVLIYGTRDFNAGETNNIISGIFGSSYAVAKQQSSGVDDQVYAISDMANDPIVNGPFGDTNGLYWGEDNVTTGTIIMPSLPPNSVQIATAYNVSAHSNVPMDSSTVWYNNTKNFVYFGDSVGAANTTDSVAYPAYYQNGNPLTKSYGPPSDKHIIANAVLELNAVAWAIQRAATNGINTYSH